MQILAFPFYCANRGGTDVQCWRMNPVCLLTHSLWSSLRYHFSGFSILDYSIVRGFDQHFNWYGKAFPYAIYPTTNMVLCASIFLVVAIGELGVFFSNDSILFMHLGLLYHSSFLWEAGLYKEGGWRLIVRQETDFRLRLLFMYSSFS